MVFYTCGHCSKKFNQKIAYSRHLARKKSCTKILHENPVEKNDNKFICNYCKKLYCRKDTLDRHMKNNCKIKKESDKLKFEQFQNQKFEQMEEQLKILTENVKQLQEKPANILNAIFVNANIIPLE